jgi:hypothetical protein
MIKPNWNKFKAKFDDNPEYYFEYFCYLLFCIEFDKPQGIFRYKNQSGIEWNPIEVDEKVIVAQCKFYDTTLGSNKSNILKMLKTIHEKYPNANELKFYTNQDWGQGKEKDTNDSKPKIEIEEKAKEYGITIDWRTNEKYFLSPDVAFNQDLMKHFFTDESIYELIYEKQQHTEIVLFNIHTEIKFDEEIIELNRTKEIEELKNKISNNQVLILTGVGGVGKTAIIKKLYKQKKDKTPFYLFKANEFDLSLINNLFGKYSLQKFIDIHKQYKEKIIVIDSSEKLLDIDNLDPFNEFLSALIQNKWKIIFTTRYSYLEDLQYRFSDFGITAPTITIKNLTQKALSTLANKYNFILSEDDKLNELIENPFYLNEYLGFYDKDEGLNYQRFKEKIWNRKITNSKSKRESCFLDLAFKRADKGKFYINIDCHSNSLDALVKDGILGKEIAGYFITHDIYEEWALEKIINKKFFSRKNNKKFFKKIGSSLPIRRSFRNWVSEKLLFDSDDIKSFIEKIIDDNKIESFWKDEVFVSILLSDYSDTFFENFERELLANDYALLKRISFLLRLACKEVDESHFKQFKLSISKEEVFSMFNKPKGNGWKSFIVFVYKHIDTIKLENINKILPILYDWNLKNKKGETTRFASLIVLKYYKCINQKDKYGYDKYIKKICNVIISGTSEIQKELEVIFNEIIKNKWKDSQDNYYNLSIMILSTSEGLPKAFPILQNMPHYVLKLANLFWSKLAEEKEANQWYSNDREEVEDAYGVDTTLRYFPSSAYQTPIYYMLRVDFPNTIDFILEFVNQSVEKYAQSGWEDKFSGIYSKLNFEEENIKKIALQIDDKITVKQYHSQVLWNIYRGTSSPVSPYLLQSIHMALEKYLLEIAKDMEHEALENLLASILFKSKSSSITAIIASVVLANSNNTINIALALFRTKEFIYSDLIRNTNDMTVQSQYTIGYGLNQSSKIYTDERIQTSENKHRKNHLEQLFLQYQYYQFVDEKKVSKNVIAKIMKDLWSILDNYYTQLPAEDAQSESDKTWRMFLARMDMRKMNTEVAETEKGFELILNSELSPELKEYSEISEEEYKNTFKYASLRLWALNKMNNNLDYKKYQNFEENPLLALEQVKEVMKIPYDKRDFIFNDDTFVEVSVILLKDYNEKLSDEDKDICKNIMLDFSKSPLQTNHRYQSGDGTVLAIRYLPILLDDFVEEETHIKIILLFNLFKGHDSAINAIATYYNEEVIKSFILGYLWLKPKYDSFYRNICKENYGIEESEVREKFFKEFEEDIRKFINNDLSINDIDFNIDVINISVILKFIKFKQVKPSVIFQEVSKVFILKVFQPKKREEKFLEDMTSIEQLDEIFSRAKEEFEDIDFEIKQRLFKFLPHLIYKLDRTEIEQSLKPLLENFRVREDISYLLLEFIRTQDTINEYNKFWHIWDLFESKIIEICKDGEYSYTNKIIQTYLLAWSPYGAIWKSEAKEWHTLKEKDKRFFNRMSKKIGHCPSTLYSISKLLNGIGSSYLNDGIGWISDMVKNNKNLLTDKLEPDTVFNLEIITRKYILENSKEIKKNRPKKKEILEVLNFLVEKGSAIGYMLRERIL